ncbi:prepilin-type N-terminal cleavage/methylation domain-containing protein [Glaciecola sp. XM2]|jgi:MSHA pilin protein MshA|uniref:prepilin-type N-terminal cleavage/methylation domain-containing protein n=1 Tax=Glaciecola sp. XM2 TaxID=1914931 RepID=UPI001BDDE0F3|nr:prepilin-type N-terminal cleavage/methylation domain-containing protein [Glaciecola sp. XM2]MBT1450460.1 prepilin-type N-terminal cleavage/methylation domain-containing protein [Glaciecola sp. XM2]
MTLQIKRKQGFTFVELVLVIVVLGVLALVALPRLLDVTTDARIAKITDIASQMKSTITLVQNKARVSGLRPVATNPGGSAQVAFAVDFGFGISEVDFRNLCPESQAEIGDRLNFLEFMNLSLSDDISTRVNNQYTLIGYDVPSSGVPTNQGCYVIYDSFGSPNCTVTEVTVDC